MIETKKDGELDFGVYEREVFSPLVSPAQTISAGQHVKKNTRSAEGEKETTGGCNRRHTTALEFTNSIYRERQKQVIRVSISIITAGLSYTDIIFILVTAY